MATFTRCPNCRRDDSDLVLWNCRDCGCVHCEECDDSSGNCPECGSDDLKRVGEIGECTGHSDGDRCFHQCPRCSRNSEGKIWKCDNCRCLHCEECDSSSGTCPECGSNDLSVAGYVD